MRLHRNFREVMDSVGPDVAMQLTQATSRSTQDSHRVYVPHQITEGHRLASVLNLEQRKRLSLAYGGCLISYSTPRGLKRTRNATRKRERIQALLAEGMKPADVAREVGVTKAYLTRFMAKMKTPSN